MEYEDLRTIVGKKRTLELLALLDEESPQNYSTIETEIDSSSAVISNRLDVLLEYGLVSRNEISKKDVKYSITQRGEAFLEGCEELRSILNR